MRTRNCFSNFPLEINEIGFGNFPCEVQEIVQVGKFKKLLDNFPLEIQEMDFGIFLDKLTNIIQVQTDFVLSKYKEGFLWYLFIDTCASFSTSAPP